MNWSLWKQELRGRSWRRFGFELLIVALAVITVQALRHDPVYAGLTRAPPICGGFFEVHHAVDSLGDLFAAAWTGGGINRFGVKSLIAHLILATLAVLLVRLRLHRFSSEMVEHLAVTPMSGPEWMAILSLRATLSLLAAVTLFALSEGILFQLHWGVAELALGSGHSVVVFHALEGHGTVSERQSFPLTGLSPAGHIIEITVRLAAIALLMASTAFALGARLRHSVRFALPLIVVTAGVGMLPEIVALAGKSAFPAPGVVSRVPFASLYADGQPELSGQPHRWLAVVSFAQTGLIEPLRAGEFARLPNEMLPYIREVRARQRHENLIIRGSYLFVLIPWAFLWLWWAKRFFLRSFLRE